jgi:hypothetical protein
MKNYEKEWCAVTLMNRFKLCLKFEFNLRQIDLLMIGIKLRDGVAITLLGISIGFHWNKIPKKS